MAYVFIEITPEICYYIYYQYIAMFEVTNSEVNVRCKDV